MGVRNELGVGGFFAEEIGCNHEKANKDKKYDIIYLYRYIDTYRIYRIINLCRLIIIDISSPSIFIQPSIKAEIRQGVWS